MHLERMVGAESLEGDGPCDSGPPPRPQLCACRWTCRPTTRASSSASCNPLRPAGTSQHSFARGWARQQGHSATACPELPGLSQRSQLHLLWLLCGTPWVAQPGRGSSMAGHRGQLSPGAGFHVSGQAPCQAVGPRSPHGTTLLPPIKSGGLCPTSSFPRAPAQPPRTVPVPETHLGWGLSLHHRPPALRPWGTSPCPEPCSAQPLEGITLHPRLRCCGKVVVGGGPGRPLCNPAQSFIAAAQAGGTWGGHADR